MEWPAVYQVVDLATLPRPDGRRGYPIPTVLFGGRDLFGMARTPAAVSKTHVTPLPGRSSVLGRHPGNAHKPRALMLAISPSK